VAANRKDKDMDLERMMKKIIINADKKALKTIFTGLFNELLMPSNQSFVEDDKENMRFFLENVKKWRPEDADALKEEFERVRGIHER
jgi:hypothetical protein